MYLTLGKLLTDNSSGGVDEYFTEIPSNNNNMVTQNPDIIGLLDSSQIDFENISTSEQQIQKEWNKVLLDQCCDFIHVLSLKGVFLYVSNSCSDMLEYEAEELIVIHSVPFVTHQILYLSCEK